MNDQFKIERIKKVITIRPMPDSKIESFGSVITQHSWREVIDEKDVDKKVVNFHTYLRKLLDEHFPEKVVKISSFDKKWMSPDLKVLHRRTQREFVKHRKSEKWRKLNRTFKKLKRKAIKLFYSNFVSDLKVTNPGKWYEMAKRIGAVNQMTGGDIKVEALEGLNNKQGAQKIAEHFSEVSNQYLPLDNKQLPCYLPAQQLPQMEEYDVYMKLKKMKNTKSTLPVDIPDKLRKEFSVELAAPLTNIINECLEQQVYPRLWKNEWVTPAPKISNPKVIKDLRKISCTSTFSKLFESILKEWIMEDISDNLDIGQFGGEKGTGTEHMIVCLVDRVLQLLDRNPDQSAVIAALVDWAAAFDHQDPTLAIKRFIEIGVRPALIPILSSYLSERQMKVKFNGQESEVLPLIGGGPQGTLLGQIMYLVQSNNNANMVSESDRFKYIDDLSILQIVCMAGLLSSYNFRFHVASDIGIDQLFLPPENFQTQTHLDEITQWTNDNLMKLNEAKSSYMIFTRTKSNFVTRLNLNGIKLDQMNTSKLLGIWLTEDLSWDRNTQEICKKAYSRMSMLSKLKYVGTSVEDLLDIYGLFIRSCAEYCSVVFHSRLTLEQVHDIERIQKTSLRIILGDMYLSYTDALEMCNLKSLHDRREKKCLDFSLRCVKHDKNSRIFPLNPNIIEKHHDVREREMFVVNSARTDAYKKSTIPYCQRMLNKHFS